MNKKTYILRMVTLLLFIPLVGHTQTQQKKPVAVPYGNNAQKGPALFHASVLKTGMD